MPSSPPGPTRAEAVERAAFEKWAKARFGTPNDAFDWVGTDPAPYCRDDDHAQVQLWAAWSAWKAALSLPAPARVEGEAARPSAPSSEVTPASLPTRTEAAMASMILGSRCQSCCGWIGSHFYCGDHGGSTHDTFSNKTCPIEIAAARDSAASESTETHKE